MKIDFLRPQDAQGIIGGDGNDPSCWDNPDDDNGGIQIPGGPIIFIPGFPTGGNG
ncbi:MAG: hypothetical protein ACJAZ9_001331 [Neolewinella sp.]|jgi:hypothetical protein